MLVSIYYSFLDSFEAGLDFVNGGELNYPSVGYELDSRGYDRCTMVLLQLSYLSNQVI